MPQAVFEFHYGLEAEQYAFFRIPKILMTEPYFKDISTDAKLLYGMMLDRMSLSIKNGWMDENERVYIYFTVEEVCEEIRSCADVPITKTIWITFTLMKLEIGSNRIT